MGLFLKKGLSNAIRKYKSPGIKISRKNTFPPKKNQPTSQTKNKQQNKPKTKQKTQPTTTTKQKTSAWFLFANPGVFSVELMSKVFSGSRSRPIREFAGFGDPEVSEEITEHSPGT